MVLLHDLLSACGYASSLPGSYHVAGISSDSRIIKQDWVFVAIPGHVVNGELFAAQAISQGACLVISQQVITGVDSDRIMLVDNARAAYSKLMATFHRAWETITLAGVTGTDGKTSVAHYYYQFLRKESVPVARIGTLGIEWSAGQINNCYMTDNTTPDPMVLHNCFHTLKQNTVFDACLEASSQGLVQSRLDGLKFKVAAFTNLGSDHIEYHGGEENYFQAKMILFKELLAGTAVINKDDSRFSQVVRACGNNNVISYGTHEKADLRISNITRNKKLMHFDLSVFGKTIPAQANVLGGFSLYNITCALGMLLARGGISIENIISNLPDIPTPSGRMEIIGYAKNVSPVVLDYAHTPNALRNVLKALRAVAPKRVIALFGCGGNRDATKRPIMGAIAAQYADLVIVTDDNPRNEDPELIRAEIMKGCPNAHNIGDRTEAIAMGLSLLEPEDILLLAGKGAEQSQIIGDRSIAHNDAQVALSIMRSQNK